MKSVITISLVLACHLLAGCFATRARCVFSVANASDAALSSVLLRDEAGKAYSFATLKAHSVGPFVQAGTDLGRSLTLEATRENGAAVTNIIRLDSPVLRTFNGRVVFQIETGACVRVFIMPAPDKSVEGDLPWATSPSWQGTPSIPGLTGQQ